MNKLNFKFKFKSIRSNASFFLKTLQGLLEEIIISKKKYNRFHRIIIYCVQFMLTKIYDFLNKCFRIKYMNIYT